MHNRTIGRARACLLGLTLALGGCAGPAPAPASSDPAPTRFVAADDGLALAVYDRPADEARTGAPTLVLLHGWCGDAAFWGELPARLGRDHRVVALDLAGHGRSGTEREAWSVVALGDDVRAVCDALALDDVVLVGHSMGAPVALAAAGALRGHVRGVLAVDSLHAMTESFTAEQMNALADTFASDWEHWLAVQVAAMVPGGGDAPLTRWIVARATRTDRRAALGLMRSFAGLDQIALARAAAVPIRAVNAAPPPRGSALELPDTELEANRAVVDFDATLIDGVGHYPQLERPAEVEAAMRAFLAALEPLTR